MLACTALVGCNNDDVVENNEQNESKVDNAYMAINIKIASDAGSRAVTDEGYAAGSTEENTISTANSIFLFYDKFLQKYEIPLSTITITLQIFL